MTSKERIDFLKKRTEERRNAKQPITTQSNGKSSNRHINRIKYSTPCIHEGAVLEWCNTCNGERKHVRDCDLYEKCTRGKVSDKVRACEECDDYKPDSNTSKARRSLPILTHPEKESLGMNRLQQQRLEMARKLAERKTQARSNKQPTPQITRSSQRQPSKTFGATEKKETVWEYGITTVDTRQDTTLPVTIESLKRAGFDKPRLFVDGTNAIPHYALKFGLPITVRGNNNVRAFANWYMAAVELYMRNPNADRYLLFQDDIIACKNLRAYLEYVPYPDGNGRQKGYLNLITYPQNESQSKLYGELPENNNGTQAGWYPSNQLGKGAQGLVFNNAAMIALLTSDYMVKRVQDERRGWHGIDGGIATAMKRMGFIEYVHTPSLIRHIGEETSMGEEHPKTQPIDKSFQGEEWDAMTLVRKENIISSQEVLHKDSPSLTLPEEKVLSNMGTDSIGDDGR